LKFPLESEVVVGEGEGDADGVGVGLEPIWIGTGLLQKYLLPK